MSASAHTPGPWTVCKHSWSRTGIYSARYPVAMLDIETDATEDTQNEWEATMAANARLIAAAPDMLAALQALSDALPSDEDMLRCEGTTPGPGLVAMRAAIAKATGATQ